jgi:DNA modification methylase
MKPIEDFVNQIHLGKWELVLPRIPSDSIDIVITSPPYNVNLGNNKKKKDSYDSYDDNMPYEDYLNWMDKLFAECHRLLRSGGRICVNIGDGSNGSVPTHADFTIRMRDKLGFIPMTTIVWDKRQIGCSTAWGSYQSPSCPSFPTQFEFIIVMGKDTLKHAGDKKKISVGGKEFQRNSRALWSFPPETRMMELYNHPACFPEELPKRLIQQLTYEEDIVLDSFSGAGTTCVAAKKLNRRYIGIEMSEQYYERSLRRLRETSIVKRVVDEKTKKVISVVDWI